MGLKQPTLGIVATALVVAVAWGFISLFAFPVFTGWVSYFLLCVIPMQIVIAVTADLTGRIKAGQVVKELAPIVGGTGGGRPDFAEAGGKLPEKIDDMLKAAESVVAKLLGA